MKNTTYPAFIALIISFLCSNVLFGVEQDTAHCERVIKVHGDASLLVIPDHVVINLGVEITDIDLIGSREEAKRIIDSVRDQLLALGLNQQDIDTDFIKVSPEYHRRGQYDEKFLGYLSKYSLMVTANDIDLLEPILSVSLASGVNHVYSIEYRTSKLREYKDRSRKEAIRAAKEKAVLLAEELGVTVGNPLVISEESSGRYQSSSSLFQNPTIMDPVNSKGANLIPINTKIYVVFELKQTNLDY